MNIESDRRSAWIVAVGLMVALLLRIAEAVWNTGTIDTEGAEYARLAENLRAGLGYVGLATDGPQLFFPPLYPIVIWAVGWVTPDAEIAARAASISAGTLLALPVAWLARHLFGLAAGFVALGLVALHPLLVRFSATAYSEMSYLALLFAAIGLTTAAIASTRRREAMLAGACFGLAALARQEALVLMLLAALLVWLLSQGPRSMRLRRAMLLASLGLLLFAPYAIWLSLQVGQPRIEGKSPLNMAVLQRMQAGASSFEAAFSVDANLVETGAYMRANGDVIRTQPVGRAQALAMVLPRLKASIKSALAHLSAEPALGMPPLFALALAGLLVRPLPRHDIAAPMMMAAVLALSSLVTVFIYYDSVRFYIAFVPIMCIAGAAGVVAVARWGRDSASAWGGSPGVARIVGGLLGLVAVSSVVLCARSVSPGELSGFDATSRPVRVAAQWLRQAAGASARVMDTNSVVAYHAQADFTWYPYCDEATAIRYIDKKDIQYLVLRDWRSQVTPYLKHWLDHGVPQGRGTVVYSTKMPSGERLQIVRWNRQPAAESRPQPG